MGNMYIFILLLASFCLLTRMGTHFLHSARKWGEWRIGWVAKLPIPFSHPHLRRFGENEIVGKDGSPTVLLPHLG